MRGLFVGIALLCVTQVVQAEPFEVWEESGYIFGRDVATGEQWQISRWDAPVCHNPAVAGGLAVWEDGRQWTPSIYGCWFIPVNPVGERWETAIAIMPEGSKTDPCVSDVRPGPGNPPGVVSYWVAWRQGGEGIRAEPLGREIVSDSYLALPGYFGDFSLEGDELVYDGGRIQLEYVPPVPEPCTPVMLIAPLLVLLACRTRRGH